MLNPKLIQQLETNLQHFELQDNSISKVTVGWQLDHSLRVINKVTEAVINSKPNHYKPKFSLLKHFILLTGYIPRGKARAPKHVVSKGIVTKSQVENALQHYKKLLTQTSDLSTKSHFSHPTFGMLNKSQTERFLNVHTKHHLKIITAIVHKA